MGLIRGIEIPSPAADVIEACRDRGLLLINAGAKVIRLVPSLIVTEAQIDEALNIIEKVLSL
jgi:acetylornithine/succinyldiaminopimelate/putrescine aminotransferase